MSKIHTWRLYSYNCFILVLLLGMSTLIQTQQQPQKQIILQLTPIIDSKQMKPFNLSLSINQSQPLRHILTLNRNNFNRNVSVNMNLFVWYNGNWINKKQRRIDIVQKKYVETQTDRFMIQFMKFRKEPSKSIFDRSSQVVILRNANLLVSYDPEASLMVAQLENPAYFISNSAYVRIDDIPKEITKVNVTLNFRAIAKTTSFIENRRHLSQLAEIADRVNEPITLFGHPFTREMIEPSVIYQNIQKNYKTFISQEKKITDKLTMLKQYNMFHLLTKGRINNFDLGYYLPFVQHQLWKNKLVYKDNVVPLYQWIFMREEIVSRIEMIRESILGEIYNESENQTSLNYQKQFQRLQSEDVIGPMAASSNRQSQIQWYISILWILIDIYSYFRYSSAPNVSISYGTFLNIWLILQLFSFTLRICVSLHIIAGIIVLCLGLMLHWSLSWLVESKYLKYHHQGSFFDRSTTIVVKNIVIMVMAANVCLHLFMGTKIGYFSFVQEGFQTLKKIDSNPIALFCWCFSEFDALLCEYYYFLAVLPQIILNIRLKKVEKMTILRIAMLGALVYSKLYMFGVWQHWSQMLLWGKEGFLCGLLMIQLILFRNSGAIKVILVEDEKEAKKDQAEVRVAEQQKPQQQQQSKSVLSKEQKKNEGKQKKKSA